MFNMNIIDMKLRFANHFVEECTDREWASARKEVYVSALLGTNETMCKIEDFSTTKREEQFLANG